jgi:hypothetical protein
MHAPPVRHRSFLLALFALLVACLSGLPRASAEIVYFDFSSDPPLAPSQQPGAWFPDRKAPAEFDSELFLGDKRLQIGISASDYDSGNAFYNTQGRKYDIIVAPGGSMEAQLYIPSDWATSPRRSDLWATGSSTNPSVATAYMIFGFTSLTGDPTLRVFDSDSGWVNLDTTIVYDQWVTLRMDFTGSAFVYSINGAVVFTDTNVNGTTQFHDVMLQAYNPNANYSAHWDNLVVDTAIVPEPTTLGCLVALGALVIAKRGRIRGIRLHNA